MSDDLVKRYRQLQEVIGGCHDGYCVVRKPKGMHTNGGCACLEDLRLHERSRIGGLLRCAQGMADRIEELEERLKAAMDDANEAEAYAGELEANLAEAVEERDKALNQLDSSRHSVGVLEKRVKMFCDGWGVADKGRIEAETNLAKAVKLIELAIELGQWKLNPSFRDELIAFTAELTGGKDE